MTAMSNTHTHTHTASHLAPILIPMPYFIFILWSHLQAHSHLLQDRFEESFCWCMCVCRIDATNLGACRGRKRTLNAPELELQAAVDQLVWVLGTEVGSSGRRSVLNS